MVPSQHLTPLKYPPFSPLMKTPKVEMSLMLKWRSTTETALPCSELIESGENTSRETSGNYFGGFSTHKPGTEDLTPVPSAQEICSVHFKNLLELFYLYLRNLYHSIGD